MKLFLLFLFFISTTYAEQEWGCASTSNTGEFIRSSNCTISGNTHVAVSNTLEIVGSNEDMNNLITITAATNKRHFYVNGENATLTLRYLKLVGGNVSSYSSNLYNPASYGGSILIYRDGGKLNLYSSIVFNNTAEDGGGIHALGASSNTNTNKNAIMNIYNSIIHNNEATYRGGGIGMIDAVCTIENTTIDKNQASGYGGGMRLEGGSVTMKNTTISNNDAGDRGGGLYINGYRTTTVTLRQTSFINNNATNGDEISTKNLPTISLDNDIFKLDIYDVDTARWNLNQSIYVGNIANIKHIVANIKHIVKLEQLLGGCECSASVLTGCKVGDNQAIIAAYKELNQCGT